jgi:hypothetical protein
MYGFYKVMLDCDCAIGETVRAKVVLQNNMRRVCVTNRGRSIISLR